MQVSQLALGHLLFYAFDCFSNLRGTLIDCTQPLSTKEFILNFVKSINCLHLHLFFKLLFLCVHPNQKYYIKGAQRKLIINFRSIRKSELNRRVLFPRADLLAFFILFQIGQDIRLYLFFQRFLPTLYPLQRVLLILIFFKRSKPMCLRGTKDRGAFLIYQLSSTFICFDK